jgi:hypothetical protein
LTGSKEIILKTLLDKFFSLGSKAALFDLNNTILIDYSPEKSVCNKTENNIYLKSLTRQDLNDSYLMDKLAPSLRRVHSGCKSGKLRQFVDKNRLGMLPLAKDSKLFAHINRGMVQSARNVGVYHNCIGLSSSRIQSAL